MKTLGLLFAVLAVLPARADEAFRDLLSCTRGNVPTALRAQDILLTSIDRNGGQRTLKGRIYAQREGALTRASIRVKAPANVAGAAYLIRETGAGREDDMYVWLPAVRRVRHITGSFANGALLGTDFSYAEARLIENSFADADGSITGTDTLDGRETRTIALIPKGTQSPYTRIRAWVDTQSCVILKAEFDHGERVLKRLSGPASALTRTGRYWYLNQMTMDDLVAGTHTELRIGNVDATDPSVPSRNFDPATFYLGP